MAAASMAASLALIVLGLAAVGAGAENPQREAARRALAVALMESTAPAPWTPPGLSALHDSPQWGSINITQRCAHDFSVLLRGFSNRALWALKMFDASTKIPGGLLYGHFSHLGNFDECLSVRQGELGGPPDFDGQHCLVSVSVSMSASGGVGTLDSVDDAGGHWEAGTAAVMGSHLLAGRGIGANPFDYFPLQVSWCVPSSCKPVDVQQIASAALDVLPVNATMTVEPSQCHTHVQKKLRAIDIFAIFLLVMFVACAAASTTYDFLTRHKADRSPLPLAFSVLSNWPKLLAVTRGRDQLSCLNGIRTISIGWVVLGHVYLTNVTLPNINLVGYAPDFIKSFKRLIIVNGTLSVDSFLVMSGLLLSFLFFKEVDKSKRFNVVKFYVHRYVRLTPSLAILVLLTVTILNYAATGPLWDTSHDALREVCEKNWWTNLLYVNNYVNATHMCLGHTWYLAVDMQLYWVSPLVLIPLWKLPRRFSMMWVSLLMLVGWIIPFTIAYTKELSPSFVSGRNYQQLIDSMKYYYWPSYSRYVPWLVGVLLGYVLHEARKKKPEIPMWGVTLGWILSTALMTVALDASYPFQQPDYVYSRVEAAFWLSLFRPMWALGLAWIIFACDQGYGGLVNIILSWNFFQPLARLSYGIYLLHFSVLNLFGGAVQTPTYLADINIIPQFLAVFVMSVMWAIPMTLLFESPIILIEKIIVGRTLQTSSEEVDYQNMEQDDDGRGETINS